MYACLHACMTWATYHYSLALLEAGLAGADSLVHGDTHFGGVIGTLSHQPTLLGCTCWSHSPVTQFPKCQH